MRLDIHCADRIGIAQEILNILVSYQVDLKGIEVDSVNCRMYVSFPLLSLNNSKLCHLSV